MLECIQPVRFLLSGAPCRESSALLPLGNASKCVRLPGVGRLFIGAVSDRDYTMVQVIMLFVAFVVTFSNLVVDLLYGYLNPRIRYA